MTTKKLIREAINSANKMYGHLEDLHDILFELVNDESIDFNERYELEECRQCLNDVELLDEIIARLGCIDID